jgi:hypothetical protein
MKLRLEVQLPFVFLHIIESFYYSDDTHKSPNFTNQKDLMKSIDQVAFCLARTYSIQKSAILDLIQVFFS